MANTPEETSRAYGLALAGYLRQPDAAVVTLTERSNPLAVVRVRTEATKVSETLPIPPERAFHVILQLCDLPSHDLWLDGRPVRTGFYPRHSVSVLDLQSNPRTRIRSAHDALVFYLSQDALDEVAAEFGTPAIDGLGLRPGLSRVDPVMARLGQYLLPALDEPTSLPRLFVDEFMLVMHAHVAQAYGSAREPRTTKGGLTATQERRAKQLMSTAPYLDLTLAEVARECGLSVSHFARAFRQSVGTPPYRWMQQQRIEGAKVMLLETALTILEIAHRSGFADQSSFTKTFSRLVGTSPAGWRRERR